jgi:hypothetical protein
MAGDTSPVPGGTTARDDDAAAGRPSPTAAAAEAPSGEPAEAGGPAEAVEAAPRPAGRRRVVRRALAYPATVLAAALVLFALVGPNMPVRFTAGAFVRVPLEGLAAIVGFILLPPRARRPVAVPLGILLGLLTVVKVIDMGFYATLNRPFNLVLDWVLIGDAVDFLSRSIGRAGAFGASIAAIVLVAAVVVLMTLSVVRLSRLIGRHRRTSVGTAAVLGLVWVLCAAFGAEIVVGVPVASTSAASLLYDRTLQVQAGLADHHAFVKQAGADPLAATPDNQLLTGLRGKDVIITFVESYGRVAVADPQFAPQVNALLSAGNRELQAAGFSSRSAFLTSPTFGGGSWLAHSTLQSGVWIDNQQRYSNLLASSRMTLSSAFRRAGWQTMDVVPAVTQPWPEGAFYQFNRLYTGRNLDYRGPLFNFSSIPDQYTMAEFQRSELEPDHPPLMAEIDLLSSHAPWAPLPHLIGWNDVGDGTSFDGMPATGQAPNSLLGDRDKIRAAYIQSILYSLSTVISYIKTYGDKNLVMVFLGDHQPAPIVTGDGASHDVPVTIVAHDKSVLDRIAGWNWEPGLRPDPHAPVWRMDTFRNQFLTTFGTQNVFGQPPVH